jgi:hypothetical protein
LWAKENTVQFEAGKTEAVLFSKKEAVHKAATRKIIRVDNKMACDMA